MKQQEPQKKKKGGRPKKGEEPRFPYNEVDDLLVRGEIVVHGEGSGVKVVYPTFADLAERFDVSRATISNFAKKRNCKRRRQELQEKVKVRPKHKLRDYQDEDVDFTRADVLRIIKKWLMRFEEAVEEGSVRFDNPSDLNTLARLQEFLTGHAESRKEVQNSITLEQIQERHMAQLKIIENTTPGERGEVVERVIEGTIERRSALSGTISGARETNKANPPDGSLEETALNLRDHLPNEFMCPYCGKEIEVEVIGADSQCVFDEKAAATHQKNIKTHPETDQAAQPSDNIDIKTDQASVPTAATRELTVATDELGAKPVELTDSPVELTDEHVELADTTVGLSSSPNVRPHTHFDDVDSDSPDGQSTESASPELPLLYKSGNSNSEHDNDYE